MKTAVVLVLVSLVVDPSYTLLISEDPDQTQPSEDENRLKRNIFLPIGALRQFFELSLPGDNTLTRKIALISRLSFCRVRNLK